MSLEKVTEHLKNYNKDKAIIITEGYTPTVEQAALELNIIPARIAKSIAFRDSEGAILIVTAGDTKIDNAKFKAEFGLKPRMLSPEETIELVGHAVGGVCPFGLNPGVKVFLDISLKRFDSIFPACGTSNSAIELTMKELEETSEFISWVDVCKNIS